MDSSLQFLLEAEEYCNQFIEISLADAFFEDTQEIKDAKKQNESLIVKAITALKNAFKALIDMIKNTIARFTKFIKSDALTEQDKKDLARLKELIKQHPELAQQTIEIADYSAYEKVYDDAIKELQEEVKKEDPSEEKAETVMQKLDKSLHNLKDKASKTAKKGIMLVSLDTAVEIANRNAGAAKAMNFALQNELVSLEGVAKELGEKNVAKMEKKIKKYSKKGRLHRSLVRLFQRKTLTLEAVLKDQYKSLKKFTNIGEDGKIKKGHFIVDNKSLTKGAFSSRKNLKLANKMNGGFGKTLYNAASTGVDVVSDQIDKIQGKDAETTFNDALEFLGVNKKK